MSNLIGEIKQSMVDLTENDKGEITALFIFSPDFTGFQGHFPNRAILPGVCIIQAVVIMHQEWKKTKIKLREIVMAKFFSSVSSGEKLTIISQEYGKKAGEILVRASASSDGKKIAELQLKVVFEDERQKA